MTAPTPFCYDVIDGTWPAASYSRKGIWTLRLALGGGNRVSAATLTDPGTLPSDTDLDEAETAMRAMNQPALVMVRQGEQELDQKLDQRGYVIKDPVTIYACPPSQLTDEPIPRVTLFTIWEPLAIMHEIWAAGGIDDARLAIMHRAAGPRTGLLGRYNDKPAGAAFAAIHDGVAMVHAVEILAHQRRNGMGRWTMRGAAFWAAQNGAKTLSVMCTVQNTAANVLYTSLGMQPVGQYHYRHLATGA